MKPANVDAVELSEEEDYLRCQIKQCKVVRLAKNIPPSRVIVLARYERTFEERLAQVRKQKAKLKAEKTKK